MGYFTILKESSVEIEIKKSIFIGYVKRVYSEEEAKEYINTIKKNHKDARHNVFAYTIGKKMEIQRYSDDGEPQGTAGIPVLEVIKKRGITDVVIVVTRYFGGILLGAGGLTRAYSNGASKAIEAAGIVEKVLGNEVIVSISYDLLGKIQYMCSENKWFIENTAYTDVVSLNLFLEKSEQEKFNKEIMQITSGKGKFDVKEDKYYFKMENRLFEETQLK
ncbi:YigZ family protein [Clostridium sediminicola]|uniref:YigZ family protein n=1 Tax=Clostridium sediminicola TaxID=3114879 RepID=UPI0031F27B8F